jgi:hypothetical protein
MIAMISFKVDLQNDRDGIHRRSAPEGRSEMNGKWMKVLPSLHDFLHENFINGAITERTPYLL